MGDLHSIKRVVAGLTLVLVLMLAGVAWGLARATHTATPPASAAPWHAPLPTGATPLAISPAGPFLAILTETPTGRTILFFDPKEQHWIGTLGPAIPF